MDTSTIIKIDADTYQVIDVVKTYKKSDLQTELVNINQLLQDQLPTNAELLAWAKANYFKYNNLQPIIDRRQELIGLIGRLK